MAADQRVVKAYSIHGHVRAGSTSEELLSYDRFFRSMYNMDRSGAAFEIRGRTVALAQQAQYDGLLAFQLVSGNAEDRAMVLDVATGNVSQRAPGRGRMFVDGSWIVYNPGRRVLAVEANRAGISKDVIERFMSAAGEGLGFERLSVSLNPIPSPSFKEEIRKLTRIRIARITINRPNGSWTASAEKLLGDVAESNAARVEVQANASRGESLSRDSGIVKEVIDIADSDVSPVANAAVVGTSPDVAGETTISLEKHNLRRSAVVEAGATGAAILDAVMKAAKAIFATRV